MKRILFFMLLLTLLLTACGNTSEEKAQENQASETSGAVVEEAKEETEASVPDSISIVSQTVDKQTGAVTEYTYETDGNQLTLYVYANQNLAQIQYQEYNEWGKQVSNQIEIVGSDHTVFLEKEYDQEGRMIRSASFTKTPDSPEAYGSIEEFEYDEDGNITAMRTAGGTMEQETPYEYTDYSLTLNDAQQLIEYNTGYGRYEYDYNDQGYVMAERYYNTNDGKEYLYLEQILDGTTSNPISGGHIIEIKYYSPEGELTSDLEYTYQDIPFDGHAFTTGIADAGSKESEYYMMSETVYNMDHVIEDQYIYDQWGHELEVTSYQNGSVSETTKKTYDEEGRLISHDTTIFDMTYGEFVYDDENRVISEIEYNNVGKPLYRMEYSYDQNGNMTTYKECPLSGLNGWYHIYQYDSFGNQISSEYYSKMDWDGTDIEGIMAEPRGYSEDEYDYDDQGNILESRFFIRVVDGKDVLESNQLQYTCRYQYNEKGQRVSGEKLNKDGKVYQTMEYVYAPVK